MRNPQLKLMDLVLGLEPFGERYEAIGVLADDVAELRSSDLVHGLHPLDAEGRRFRYTPGSGKTYIVELFPDAGLVRLARSTQPASSEEPSPEGTLGGPVAQRAVAAAMSKRGEGAITASPVLGLLAGAPLHGMSQPHAPRHIFTLRFDPRISQWRAYDGGLVPWMKRELLPSVA